MKMIKKYSNWIMIILVFLVLFNGMKSCSKGRKINKLENQTEEIFHQKDSVIKELNDSIVTLNNVIKILETEKKGFEQNIALQNKAINQIAESKKNINVTVKK